MTSTESAQELRARNAGRTGLVIVASTRAAAGEYEDRSGIIAVEWLRERGIDTPDALIVADADVPAVIDQLFTGDGSTGVAGAGAGNLPELDALPDVVLTSGGTGISPSDVTVDAVERVLTRPLPGIAAEFFRVGGAKVPTAILSRCVAGIVDRPKPAFVMTLPGSRGGVRDGLEVLDGVLEHLLDQLAGGGDHEAKAAQAPTAEASPPAPTHVPESSAAEQNHTLHGSGCCHGPAVLDPPHVAEQTGVVVHTRITEEPLESLLSSAKDVTATPAMGAVSTFEGVVRDHDGGELVDTLTYSCHPSASHVLREVVEEVVASHPDVRAWVAHRTGPLEIGDLAFLVIVAAAHRGPAFTATAELADQVKARVPIWKEQKLRSGATTWVGLDS
ncbi:molybdenum cofactor biosynthesis protein MoaE [Corynebacterium urealyticum]|uniref:molybdenum cofactor biosynthesis protein MoaE n=1 Tax=Corynebacterium urealyticum TaxID=43771 RepID=UPI0002B3FDBC|nr:molybdenum cofactor biosynthesis protein MoaE [Corynebacterium urealyticum]AGE37260.1 putative molybdopterin biosynthesis protein [Corynebacterium urealyticum DSM 7111]QQB07116.1 molybdenum cofactor biosynthesis protein MoaE [Corynebacterium urealyticum]